MLAITKIDAIVMSESPIHQSETKADMNPANPNHTTELPAFNATNKKNKK